MIVNKVLKKGSVKGSCARTFCPIIQKKFHQDLVERGGKPVSSTKKCDRGPSKQGTTQRMYIKLKGAGDPVFGGGEGRVAFMSG